MSKAKSFDTTENYEYGLDEESIENIKAVAESNLPASELATKVLKIVK